MVEVSGITIFHVGEDGHRTPYFPGMDLTHAPQEVLDAVAVHWTPEAVAAWREANQGEPAPPATDWPGFVIAIQNDVDFKTIWGAANAADPLAAQSLLVAFGHVATGGLETFTPLYNAVCVLGGATVEQRNAWATLAETHHCPAEFVAVVRG